MSLRIKKFGRERPKENPAGQGGAPRPIMGKSLEQDTTIMTAVPLFAKDRAPAKRVVVTEQQQLSEWLRRGKKEIFSVTTRLTPDLARLLLAHNDSNRPVSFHAGGTRSVFAYANAMKRGEWVLNGESLIISDTGQLNDGQHRCYAAIEADVAVPVQITFGVKRDTRHTVDQGIARSPGAILSMDGEVNVNALACALQMLWALDFDLTLNHRPSMDQLRATLDRHPTIRDAIPAVLSLCSHYHLSVGYIAASHYLCSGFDECGATHFLSSLTTGLNIQSVNSPVARLGVSKRTVERDLARGKKIDPEVMAQVEGTDLDKGVILDDLARTPRPQQVGRLAEIRLERSRVSPAADPLNDLEATEKQLAALMAAWNRAGPEARERFLERVDTPVFDRGAA